MNDYGKIITLSCGSTEIGVAPELGFSLISFRKNGVEILNTGLATAFLETRKGFGPLILPHFNQAGYNPRIGADAFPHIRGLEKLGIHHPFQHGIGRYVAWEYSKDQNSVTGTLDGNMRSRGFSLTELAGFNFSANVIYNLRPEGLEIAFDIKGAKPIAAGIHFYYDLRDRTRTEIAMPACFADAPKVLSLAEPINKVFPIGEIKNAEALCVLKTEKYSLETRFPVGPPAEQAFESLVIFCPEKADFVCIEPISYIVGEENLKKSFQGKILLTIL
jgi:galactose mutarotase-like enzyme